MQKKKSPKKTARKLKKVTRKPKKKSSILGEVTHYFEKINVAVVKLGATLKVGDYVEFKHGDKSFCQMIESIQVDHKNIPGARAKSEVGLKVVDKVKEGWLMLKAKQPTLLDPIKKPEDILVNKEPSAKFEYTPIFPGQKGNRREVATPIQQPGIVEQKPQEVKIHQIQKRDSGQYSAVKFLKF